MRLLSAASALFSSIGYVLPGEEQSRFARAVMAGRMALGDQPFGTAWSLGAVLAIEEAVAEAMEVTLTSQVPGQPDIVPRHGLSAREYEVLRLIAVGRSNVQIAESLSISPRTVSTHATHILDKLGLSSRAEVIAFAFHHGFA